MKKKSKYGRNPKLNPKTHCVMVRFDDVEWNRFLTMYEESNVYAKAVFLKAHFFGQKFKVLKVDKVMLEYYTKLSDFHAQFRGIATNYNHKIYFFICAKIIIFEQPCNTNRKKLKKIFLKGSVLYFFGY